MALREAADIGKNDWYGHNIPGKLRGAAETIETMVADLDSVSNTLLDTVAERDQLRLELNDAEEYERSRDSIMCTAMRLAATQWEELCKAADGEVERLRECKAELAAERACNLANAAELVRADGIIGSPQPPEPRPAVKRKRPTLAELEDILSDTKHVPVEIRPDGEIVAKPEPRPEAGVPECVETLRAMCPTDLQKVDAVLRAHNYSSALVVYKWARQCIEYLATTPTPALIMADGWEDVATLRKLSEELWSRLGDRFGECNGDGEGLRRGLFKPADCAAIARATIADRAPWVELWRAAEETVGLSAYYEDLRLRKALAAIDPAGIKGEGG